MTRLKTLDLLSGARAATGTAVVIDVFRAFTLAPLAMSRGLSRLYLARSPDQALALKRRHPGWLLAGELEGRPVPGFDYPNSPAAVRDADLQGKTLVLRTSSGVQGLLAAEGADDVVAASFANAGAVVRYLADRAPDQVCWVCMGWSGREITYDDRACAEYLAAGLQGRFPDFEPIRRRLRSDPSGAKFFDPRQPWFPAEDFDLCVRPSWLDVVPRLDRDSDPPRLVPAEPAESRG
ncbi:MAG: 2-phosphosulfolactate phosphatase [Gammaproteobacteria bacterium]